MDGIRAKIHLGSRIFVRVMEDKDIDIRQWHRCGKESRPCQLGVRLSAENWQKLLEAREHLRNDTHLEEEISSGKQDLCVCYITKLGSGCAAVA